MGSVRFVIGLFFLVATSAGAFAAPAFEDPKPMLEYAYKPYSTDEFPEDPFELFSKSLIELVKADQQRTPEGEIGALDFDPFIDAQDYENVSVKIAEPLVEGDHAKTSVILTNFGREEELVFEMVKEADGWKIDDIQALGTEYPWRLSEILAANPLTN